jgi:hypothetical protein
MHLRPEISDAEFSQVSPAASMEHLVIQFRHVTSLLVIATGYFVIYSRN